MMSSSRLSRSRSLRPVLVSLEDRALLNAAMPHLMHDMRVSGHIHVEGHQIQQMKHKVTGPTITNRTFAGSNRFATCKK